MNSFTENKQTLSGIEKAKETAFNQTRHNISGEIGEHVNTGKRVFRSSLPYRPVIRFIHN
jgi:hypothetical protein